MVDLKRRVDRLEESGALGDCLCERYVAWEGEPLPVCSLHGPVSVVIAPRPCATAQEWLAFVGEIMSEGGAT
jgi:hypothetical protein